jgi:hypothetical protein
MLKIGFHGSRRKPGINHLAVIEFLDGFFSDFIINGQEQSDKNDDACDQENKLFLVRQHTGSFPLTKHQNIHV